MGNRDEERRVLDVYYTDKGTKLFVEDGVLVEQTIKSSSSSHPGMQSDNPPCDGMKWYPTLSSLMPSGMPFSRALSSISYDPPKKEPPLSEEEKVKRMKIQTTRISKPALAHYNSKNRTKYELVDPICSNPFLLNGLWYHCNFTATNDILSDSSAKLFFAELKIARLKSGTQKYVVTACRPIDGAKTVIGCDMCEECVLHPPHGFRQGLHPFKPRTLRPRSNGKAARKF